VFTDFFCGDGSELPPRPAGDGEADGGWIANGPTPEAAAAELQRLVDAGADSIVLVPMAGDTLAQVELATTEIWPLLG
jgi:hypothetical protein